MYIDPYSQYYYNRINMHTVCTSGNSTQKNTKRKHTKPAKKDNQTDIQPSFSDVLMHEMQQMQQYGFDRGA